MNKEQMILALISNEASPFTEDDKELLMKKDEATLQGLVDKFTEKKEEGAPKVNEEKVEKKDEKVTAEQYLQSEDIPESIKVVLSDSLEQYRSKHTVLVNKIMSHEKNTFTKEFLEKKDVKELTSIVSLMGAPAKNEKATEEDFDLEKFDFSGNLPGFINRGIVNEKQSDGTGVPEVMRPKWNADGTPDMSQYN
jgi:hypothetical protein